jgi:5-methylcytosine-specific restriction enzyme A
MSSLIENLTQAREQLDQIIRQIQGAPTTKITQQSFETARRVFIDDDKPEFMLVGRSGKWPEVRKKHLEKHPTCAACGMPNIDRQLEVHHVVPYHIAPNLELDPENLITLCDAPTRPCHRCFGHLWDWHKSNPYVRAVCSHFLTTISEQNLANIKSDVPERYDT